MNNYIFTCGDINGIGPEISVKAFNKIFPSKGKKVLYLSPAQSFLKTIELIKPKFTYSISKSYEINDNVDVTVIDLGKFNQKYGKPTEQSGEASFRAIELSFALAKQYDAPIITAPISKEAINLAGHNFPGHTEIYAEWCGVKDYVMMFLSKKMNAALVTIHTPINKVSKLITAKKLDATFNVVIESLKNELEIKQPKAAVLGLNPHAGESGLLGSEEQEVILPAIAESKYVKMLAGPYTPDGFFGNKIYKDYDVIIGMYHDQVLIPFKLLNFDEGVNYTAGLPIVRTSPDHGTAFSIAGKGIASEKSMMQAFIYAQKIKTSRNRNESN